MVKSKRKRVALYLRVSTSEQTTRNQRRELEAVAARHKWDVVGVFEDSGISGAKGRDQRPGLDAMIKMVARREVDMVAAWSVDRIGRSLIDLLDFLRELHAKGVSILENPECSCRKPIQEKTRIWSQAEFLRGWTAEKAR